MQKERKKDLTVIQEKKKRHTTNFNKLRKDENISIKLW